MAMAFVLRATPSGEKGVGVKFPVSSWKTVLVIVGVSGWLLRRYYGGGGRRRRGGGRRSVSGSDVSSSDSDTDSE